MAILQPLLLWLLFKTYYVYVMYIAKKPVATTIKDETGYLMQKIMVMSLLIFIGCIVYLMQLQIPHSNWVSDETKLCGSLKNHTSITYYI